MHKRATRFPKFCNVADFTPEIYELMMRQFPPTLEFSYVNLNTWWSIFDTCKIAKHGNNYVYSLWLPGYENASGLSILGGQNIDETICAVFDFQASTNRERKLVHIPDFVIGKIRYPEMYGFEPEPEYEESILNTERMLTHNESAGGYLNGTRRYITDIKRASICDIDLSDEDNLSVLLSLSDEWQQKGGVNDTFEYGNKCFELCVCNAEKFKLKCMGMKIDDRLHAFIVYTVREEDSWACVYYARFSYAKNHIFDMAVGLFAHEFKSLNIINVNIDIDLGHPSLRRAKLSVTPDAYVKKFTIRPAEIMRQGEP